MLMDRYTPLQTILVYICIALFLTFILLPFAEMFRTSLSPMSHLFHAPYEIWTNEFSFQAYHDMWIKVPLLGRYIWNSIYIATMVTGIAMIFIIPAAYAYAGLEFPFKQVSLGAFLAVNMFTGAVLLIPLYRVMRTLNLLNTYWAMIIPGVAFLIPTGIWLLRGYLEKIPRELEEAAFVDGASRMYTLRRVVLPLAVPGLIVVGVSVFIARTLSNTSSPSPSIRWPSCSLCPPGLNQFIGYQSVDWNQMMAAALTGILPVMVVFLFLQKYLVAGLTAGAIKE